MTAAHPGADYCALCMVQGVLTPAMESWPGAPAGSHISPEIRAELGKLTPELAAGVRRVADTK